MALAGGVGNGEEKKEDGERRRKRERKGRRRGEEGTMTRSKIRGEL